jgi:membrane-associated protease RseP (regulator of RpoE activity)
MTEREFRELLLSMDDKVRIRKMGTSGDVWVAMGQLVNGATERDLSSYLEAMALSATVTGENGTVWLKVSAKEEVTDEKPPIVIPPLNIGLFLTTLLTTLMAGTLMEGGNPLVLTDLALGFPFSGTLLLILGCHEFGHYCYGKKHNVDVTLPYFIPAPTFIGTLGAVIRIKSPIQHRKALLDIGAAGPIAGFLVAVPLLFYGLSHSTVIEGIPVGSVILGESLLMKLATAMVFPGLSESQDVMLHSIAFAGWIGLLVTMLNLLPIGQLDGGHITYALLGKRHDRIAKWAFLMLIPLSFLSLNWLLWGGLILLLMRTVKHPPILDMETPLTQREKLIGVTCLVIFILSFVPVPFG